MSSTSFGEHTTSNPKPVRKIEWTEIRGPLAIVVNGRTHHLGKGDMLGWSDDNQIVLTRSMPPHGI